MNIRIGFFDSGVGGISYLHSFRDILVSNTISTLPAFADYSLLYLADTQGFPYGEKTFAYLKERITQIVLKFVSELHLDVLVLACNTASMLMLDTLRTSISQPIIGVVPAIKLAIAKNLTHIFVMNTTVSTHARYMKELTMKSLKEYSAHSEILIHSCQPLVTAIENMITSEDEAYYHVAMGELTNIVHTIKKLQCEAVVLGCTHFLHIKNMLVNLLPSSITVVDSLEGVTNRIAHIVTHHYVPRNVHTTNNKSRTINADFYYTQEKNIEKYKYLCHKYHLEFKGIL